MNDYRESHLARGADYDAAVAADPFAAHMTSREQTILLRLIRERFPDGIGRSLDFACGTGRITRVVEPHSRESFGVDVSESMLEQARAACPRTRFLLQDITREPLRLAPFDLVTAFRFFGNAQDELRRLALEAIGPLLTPGGILVLNDHRNPWSIQHLALRATGRAREHLDLHHWKLRRLLEESGFRLLRTWGIGLWRIRAKADALIASGSAVITAGERLSEWEPLAPFCPDAVVVAQRN